MGTANTVQDSFRWRDDDGSESAATWKAATNINPASSNFNYDENYRLRILLQNTGGKDETDGYGWEYSIDDGTWTTINASSNFVKAVTSGNVTDGDSTTQQIGGGTHDEGYIDTGGLIDEFTLTQAQESENELVFQFVKVDFSGGEKVEIKQVFDSGADLDGYTNMPTLTNMPTPVEGEIQQSHFRIRNIGALQTLNQDSDWAAALDTDATLDAVEYYAGCLFGLRIELEEVATVSDSKIVIPKLQYRVNAGTWTDCGDVTAGDDYIDPPTSTAVMNVIVVNKATITDGAATTDILSGSSKTFVAGTGEHDTIAASVTLNDEHTEIEWRILIKNRYETRQESVTGDEYEFRVVESDNTILDGTYVIPKITLNITDGYLGGTGIETFGKDTIIDIPDGTLYQALESHRVDPQIIMLKSIDGGITWLQQDAGVSMGDDMESWSMQYDNTNKVLHCLHVNSGADYYQFGTKDHATLADQWITANTADLEASIDSSGQASSLIIRGTNVYAFYADLAATDQIWYRKKANLTDGTWAARVSIDTEGGSTDFIGISCVLGPNSDLIHMFYIDWSLSNLHHRTLNTSDVLGTRHTCESDILQGNDGRNGMTSAISWYNGSVEKAMIGYLDNTNTYLYTVVVEEDGTPDTRQLASNSVAVFYHPPGVSSEQQVADIGHDPADDTVYALYVDDATHDLWRASRSDSGSWTGHTEESDARDIHALRGVIYTKADSSVVFGYVFDDAYNQDATARAGESGSNGYDEYVIAAGGARRIFITHV